MCIWGVLLLMFLPMYLLWLVLCTCGSNNTSNVIALLWWSSVKQIFILMCPVCGVACFGLVLRILYVESGVRCTAVTEPWLMKLLLWREPLAGAQGMCL